MIALEVQEGAAAGGGGSGDESLGRGGGERRGAPGEGFLQDAAGELAIGGEVDAEDGGDGWGDIDIADGQRVDEVLLEVGADGGHVVPGLIAGEGSVVSLAFLEVGVGDLDAGLEVAGMEGEAFEADDDGGGGEVGGADEADGAEGESSGAGGGGGAEGIVGEDGADIVEVGEGSDGGFDDGGIFAGDVEEVGTAISGDDEAGVGGVEVLDLLAEDGVAADGVLRGFAAEEDLLVDGIASGGADFWIEEALVGEEREVDGEEACGEGESGLGLIVAGGLVGERGSGVADGGVGGVEFAAGDGGEAVVGGDEDVGGGFEGGMLVEVVEDLGKAVVGVVESETAGVAVDAGGEVLEAVALVVLGAVGVAGPEEEDERLVGFFEVGEDEVGGDVSEPLLLGEIGGAGSGGGAVAGEAVAPGGVWGEAVGALGGFGG